MTACSAPLDVDFVRFPPGWRNVLVPVGPASATALGMTLYTASKPATVAAQYGLWAAVRATGGHFRLPGRPQRWAPPIPAEVFWSLWREWRAVAGREPDGIAVYERLQQSRQSLTLLVCAGARSMLVRVRSDPATLRRERAISEAAEAMSLRTLRVPRLVGTGDVAGWHWVGYEVMSLRPHRPQYRLGTAGFQEISALVESVVARPAAVPTGWRGAHGDLAPWNLRRGSGHTWLIDWEDAGWAPPGADELYLRAVVAAIRPGPVRPLRLAADQQEAGRHWAQIVEARATAPSEQRLARRLRTLLGDAA